MNPSEDAQAFLKGNLHQGIWSHELASRVRKAYICFCFDDEDSFEDEIDECMVEELAVLKSSQYVFWGSYC